jgi:catechol 2,3-dioxygenase-like lactoylglutathione lyase family enzyme
VSATAQRARIGAKRSPKSRGKALRAPASAEPLVHSLAACDVAIRDAIDRRHGRVVHCQTQLPQTAVLGAVQAAFMLLAYRQRHTRRGDMETQKVVRGRLIDHLQIVTKDLEQSRRFYSAIFEALGIPMGGQGPGFFWADELFVSTKDSLAAVGELTGRLHFALQAKDKKMVERFHAAGLGAGGKDNGKPGERPYHPGYYAAFLLDPDGNNVEAVYHGEGKRSADAIEIKF